MSKRTDSFKKTVALEEVEEVPVIPTVSGWVARCSGVPFKQFIYDPEAIVKGQIDAQKAVGHDALFAYIDPLYIPEAFGCSLVFLSSGSADASPLDLKNEDDVKALPIPDIRKNGRIPLILKVVEKLVRSPEREVPVLSLVEGPFTNCARILGTEKMMRAVMKNRPMIERMLEKVGQLLSQFGQAAGELGADALIIADPVGSSTMISPKMYREMVLPHLQRLIQSLRIPAILHVCGDTEPILDMMAETGAKILSLDQCMDLAKAKQTVTGRCGIGGNVDPINTLLLGTVEDVKRDALRCLQQGGKKGYILMAGCSVPPRTPLENLRAMVETAKHYYVQRSAPEGKGLLGI
jgi:MtaA/CmuA family methyltransferase